MSDTFTNFINNTALWDGPTIALPQMLDARERRALRQNDLLARYGKPLLCFTMNIAGPVKNTELIRRAFFLGADAFRLQCARSRIPILFEALLTEDTGCEAYFVADADAVQVKRLTCQLEDADLLGRLYDMDVIAPDGRKLDREELSLPGRRCLICGSPAKECSSRRVHSVAELQQKTAQILLEAVLGREASAVAEYAVRALLYEVSVTPKPGLVDRANSGSHRDMGFFTFLSSSAALFPYLEACARIGQDTALLPPEECFRRLREPGMLAENRMLRATAGVNTHKGAVFTMGVLAAACGRLSAGTLLGSVSPALRKAPEAVLDTCRAMTAGLVASDFATVTKENAVTAGQRLYAEYGITGIRGQMEAGLPAVREHGLPLLKKLLSEGKSKDEAGAAVLLSLLAHTTDTNLIHRGGRAAQQAASAEALRLLEESGNCPSRSALQALDADYIRQNLSPGGSADLLAVCWFLYTLETEAL